MKGRERLPELLVPAGGREQLEAAILYGADAVYMGGPELSLRTACEGFSGEELGLAVADAHTAGVRVYYCLNAMPYDAQLSAVEAALERLPEMGVDGLIAADPGVIWLAKKHCPSVPLHLSTQAHSVNGAAVAFWREAGVERINLARELGLKTLYIKDDGQNPTASLKDRASAMAVAKAQEAGAHVIACSSTGNAASSLAGNAAAAGLQTFIFVPSRAPKGKVAQLMTFGATVISVQGSYEDTFELSKQAIDRWGWYNRNAAINPYLSEGKKTVAYEIAEQLDWQMPDFIAISVGDGCTIAGLWKGLKDLHAVGLIDRLPRLISAQAEGCCPINRAIAENRPWEPMEENTLADSIAVGVPRNADKALMAIRESNGIVVNVTDEEIMAAQKLLGTTCGVFGEPAGVTGTAAVKKLCEQGVLGENDTVVSVVTGNGLKDVANAIKFCGEPMSLPNDLDLLVEEFDKRGIKTEA